MWPIAKQMTWPAIGVAIAYALKAPPLVLFSSTIAGAAGAAMGDSVGAYVASVCAAECGKLVAGETKVDILVTPAVTVLVGVLIGSWISTIGWGCDDSIWSINYVDYAITAIINGGANCGINGNGINLTDQ